MISIVNYGLGNILAFANIYKRLNIPVNVVSNATELANATKIILPGVGSFDWAMTSLNQSGMRELLDTLVLEHEISVIGVCVGMQMMANSSDEGVKKGLGWIDANVCRFDDSSSQQSTHLPHMGWNDVRPVKQDMLFDGLENDARFYFLHSYYFSHSNDEQILAQSEYGSLFTCSAHYKNIYGVQFHPEKSHHWGVRLLKNFAENC